MTPQEAWVQFCLTLPREPAPCVRKIRDTIGCGLREGNDLYKYSVRYVHSAHPIAEEKVHGEAVAARLDADGTAQPLTRIISHPPVNWCVGPGTRLVQPEYEDQSGKRIPLV